MAEQANVSLAPDVQAIVRDAVVSGEFPSREEMVAEALRQWQARRQAEEPEQALLRQKWAEALASNGPYHSLEDVFDPLEKQYASSCDRTAAD